VANTMQPKVYRKCRPLCRTASQALPGAHKLVYDEPLVAVTRDYQIGSGLSLAGSGRRILQIAQPGQIRWSSA
jgi:hypothetical protein